MKFGAFTPPTIQTQANSAFKSVQRTGNEETAVIQTLEEDLNRCLKEILSLESDLKGCVKAKPVYFQTGYERFDRFNRKFVSVRTQAEKYPALAAKLAELNQQYNDALAKIATHVSAFAERNPHLFH